jgi:hypothetical protein
MLANNGDLLLQFFASRGIAAQGSRLTSVIKGLHAEIKSRFVQIWADAFDAQLQNPQFEGARASLLAAALDPQTWVLEMHLPDSVAKRVRSELKRLFLAEFKAPTRAHQGNSLLLFCNP